MEPGARVSERWSPGRCVTVELRDPPATTEDPMTEDRMAPDEPSNGPKLIAKLSCPRSSATRYIKADDG